MATLAVLGLGNMGSALAHCLLKVGFSVCVWNRTPEKTKSFAKVGAVICVSPEDAVAASDFVIVCIKSHKETVDLISGLSVSLKGKTICDMSTGDTSDADSLVSFLIEKKADYMLGMINAYPSGIGSSDTTILTVGSAGTWDRYGEVIRCLGGKSAQIGEKPATLAALFAGLFTVRQGFMFGMIYGALVCQKAGVPMQVYADQLPATIKLVNDYYGLFARTVPTEDYDDAEASLKVYALAQEGALKTCVSLNAPADFIRIMHDRTKAAWEGGYGDKQLTSLVKHMTDAG
ncbi:NAD(P)-binding domain-containing protein [Ruegeria atlantica]|uniref:NAD(P)-binding domain-containing protein n=2 Tax=Ruegeria atlantica TaxID=81569 RepID=A0AA90YV84_9RHOB|nr:NAD(P)-binding domain-containing protein [Ruegeria atlantica]